MSIIKPGDIRVDVLGISKIKQQGGRWGGGVWGEKHKIEKKKNFQVIFGNETEGKQKKPPENKARKEECV